MTTNNPSFVGITQLAEILTEKPGAIWVQIRVPIAAGRFLLQSAFSANSLTVFVQPLCAVTCINMLKISDTGTGHIKILYTLTGMGSTAFAAAVTYPGKET